MAEYDVSFSDVFFRQVFKMKFAKLYKYIEGQLVIDEKTCLKGMVKKLSTNPQLEENQYYYSEDPI